MTRNWKKTAFAVIVSTSLMTAGVPAVWADGPAAEAGQSSEVGVYYTLTDTLQASVKSVISEKTPGGTRIGAVVNLKNTGNAVTRVPEYEVRVKTDQGIEYTLKASAGSPTAVQPQSKVEISYLLTIDRQDSVLLTDLSWVDVDYYTYPKTENRVLTVNVANAVWTGGNAAITDQAAVKKWGDPFRIDTANSPVTFTPTNIQKDMNTYSVTVLAENPGAYSEKVPEFLLQGRSASDTFQGARAEQEELMLDPGEKKYIHYAIKTEKGETLTSLDVLTPETYLESNAQGQTTAIRYTVGRYNIVLPTGGVDNRYVPAYTYSTPIAIDPVSKLYNPNVDVSLVEFNIHDGQGSGYKTAVAKFALKNKSGEPIEMPVFASSLSTADGYDYSGTRQTLAAQQLLPNLSHVVSYSYILPETETGESLRMKLQEVNTPAEPGAGTAYKSTVATVQVTSQEPGTMVDTLSFYPFNVKINSYILQQQFVAPISYTYKLRMDLDVTEQEGVVVDQDFSKMELALVDSRERVLAQEQLSFVNDNKGMGKLTSGEINVTFTNLRQEQLDNNMWVYVYETITTPSGPAKRLAAKLKPQ